MLTLSRAELEDFTALSTPVAQRRLLDELGIPWKDVRGRTIVLKTHVENWMLGRPTVRSVGPRMDQVK